MRESCREVLEEGEASSKDSNTEDVEEGADYILVVDSTGRSLEYSSKGLVCHLAGEQLEREMVVRPRGRRRW